MKKRSKAPEKKAQPRSLPIARKGVATGSQFAALMSAMMSDIIEGHIAPETGNAACNAGGKLLKVVEMQYKYGSRGRGVAPRELPLTAE